MISRNINGRNIYNLHTHIRVGHEKAVTGPDTNTTGSNEADTNANTCWIGQNFISIAYTNQLAYVYPYSEAYETIENVTIIYGDTDHDHMDGNTYILVFHESLYYVSHMKLILINPNAIRLNGLGFYDNSAIYE